MTWTRTLAVLSNTCTWPWSTRIPDGPVTTRAAGVRTFSSNTSRTRAGAVITVAPSPGTARTRWACADAGVAASPRSTPDVTNTAAHAAAARRVMPVAFAGRRPRARTARPERG